MLVLHGQPFLKNNLKYQLESKISDMYYSYSYFIPKLSSNFRDTVYSTYDFILRYSSSAICMNKFIVKPLWKVTKGLTTAPSGIMVIMFSWRIGILPFLYSGHGVMQYKFSHLTMANGGWK